MNHISKRFPGRINLRKGHIDMTHGAGGRAMAHLIDELFIKHFDNELLNQGNDQAIFDVPVGRLVMSTDGHVVSPIFSPAAISDRFRFTAR